MNQAAPNPLLGFILPMGFVFLFFYFLVIKPQKQEQKKHLEMLGALKKNDGVITSGGIHGTIVNVKEKTFVVRVDDNARIEINKGAVSAKKA